MLSALFQRIKNCNLQLALVVLTILICITVEFYIFYPGILYADAKYQYHQAAANNIVALNPPLNTYLWSIIFLFTKNPAAMLLIQIFLIWATVYIYYRAYQKEHPWISLLFFLVPLMPTVLNYSVLITKDVHLTFFLALTGALLTYISNKKNRITIPYLILIWVPLLLGISSKIIGYKLLIPMALWFAKIVKDNSDFWCFKTLARGFTTTIISIMCTINLANYLIVKADYENNGWQMIKLCDLAGMSFDTGQTLFPDYIIKNPIYNDQKMRKLYNENKHLNCDPLIFTYSNQNVLALTQNPHDLNELWLYWTRSIIKYPQAYIKHRYLFYKALLKSELRIYFTGWNLAEYPWQDNRWNLLAKKYMLAYMKYSPVIYHLPFMVIYCLTGLYIYYRSKSKGGFNLFSTNLVALTNMLALFSFTMAIEPRYNFIAITLVYLTTPIFIMEVIDYWKSLPKGTSSPKFN